MLDDDQLESHIRELVIDLCEVMYRNGYDMVPIGAMMRLVGVGDDRAQLHDSHYFALDDEFLAILESRKTLPPEPPPPGATIH